MRRRMSEEERTHLLFPFSLRTRKCRDLTPRSEVCVALQRVAFTPAEIQADCLASDELAGVEDVADWPNPGGSR